MNWKANTKIAPNKKSSKGRRWNWMPARWPNPTKKKTSSMISQKIRNIVTVDATPSAKWWHAKTPIANDNGSTSCVWRRRIYQKSGTAQTARSKETRPRTRIPGAILSTKNKQHDPWSLPLLLLVIQRTVHLPYLQAVVFLHAANQQLFCGVPVQVKHPRSMAHVSE